MIAKDPANRGPGELADLFSRHARRRTRAHFKAVWSNEDVRTYRVAQRQIKGGYTWLEQGIVDRPHTP